MSSTNLVNFALRQNKSIERAIAFDCLAAVHRSLSLENAVYIGFGSVWFVDFVLAHRLLGIETMISIESDAVTFKRALFNRPYRTLEILEGSSSEVVPQLLDNPELAGRPWVLWLDYDKGINEDRRDELAGLIPALPEDSVLMTTFNAHANTYGAPTHRPRRIRELFGIAAPETMSLEESKDKNRFMQILGHTVEDYLASQAVDTGRVGGYVPTIRLLYVDNAPMVTIGGTLPAVTNEGEVRRMVAQSEWLGRSDEVIAAPPLTGKEILALQSKLPTKAPVTREDVLAMGFDLEEEQLHSFVSHYLRYPQYA